MSKSAFYRCYIFSLPVWIVFLISALWIQIQNQKKICKDEKTMGPTAPT